MGLTTHQDNDGVSELTWNHDLVRDSFYSSEPDLASLIDEVDPPKKYKIFYARYRYGELQADTEHLYFPREDGVVVKISDFSDRKLKDSLSYGNKCSPMGIVLKNSFEYFVDIDIHKAGKDDISFTYPHRIAFPGLVFPMGRLFSNTPKYSYAPNGMLCSIAGARSTFLLPPIFNRRHISKFQKELGCKLEVPRSYKDHHSLFTSITNSAQYESDWRACIAYLSEDWVKKILNDPSWIRIKNYLLEKFWSRTEFNRAHDLYNMALAMIANRKSSKVNAYTIETIQKIFKISLGISPGFVPVTDKKLMPLDPIQKSISDYFDVGENKPTIIAPGYYHFYEKNQCPVYYSLQHQTQMSIAINAKKQQTAASELRSLVDAILDLSNEILDSPRFANTIYQAMAESIKFIAFHQQENMGDGITPIYCLDEILDIDARINPYKADSAKFFQGCLLVTNSEKTTRLKSRSKKFEL